MPKLNRLASDLLDVLFDVTEPIAGECPVCAFWRGFAIAAVIAIAILVAAFA